MNSTMVREIRGTKINPKSFFKNWGTQNTRGRKLREQIPYVNSININPIMIINRIYENQNLLSL
jgi:hypothetical protein